MSRPAAATIPAEPPMTSEARQGHTSYIGQPGRPGQAGTTSATPLGSGSHKGLAGATASAKGRRWTVQVLVDTIDN